MTDSTDPQAEDLRSDDDDKADDGLFEDVEGLEVLGPDGTGHPPPAAPTTPPPPD